MGVDQGGRGQVPQNLERGIVPPDFVMLQNFKHQITCIRTSVAKCVFASIVGLL